jgi:hypothetical protein
MQYDFALACSATGSWPTYKLAAMKVNPFADYGTVVSGDRFIGRAEEIRQLDGRLFGEGGFGSLAVTGLPRIGKSSLLRETLRRAAPKLSRLRAVVAREDVGACGSVDELFHALVRDLLDDLPRTGVAGDAVESINSCARHFLDTPVTIRNLRAVFRCIRQAGVRPICILDEFDAGRYLFAGATHCFHWLRELASNPDFKAAVVLVSKRGLSEVSRLAGHESNYWANVLMPVRLKPFSEQEVGLFRAKLEASGVACDEQTWREVSAVVGGHPYLLDAFACQAWERVLYGGTLEIGWFRHSMRQIVRDYFDEVSTVLRDGSMMRKLFQVLVGPQLDVTFDDLESLVDYGVLHRDGDKLRPFSEGFGEYIRSIERYSDFWPLWRDTERALRDSLETLLTRSLGESWASELKKTRPNKLAPLIEACEERMNKEQSRYGARTGAGLLAYAYPQDLYQIMASDWPKLGAPLLGPDRQAWAVKFNLLAKVRTPMAHARDEVVSPAERTQAEGICQEILERYEDWKSSAVHI